MLQQNQLDQSHVTSIIRKQCWVETTDTENKVSVVVEGDNEITQTPIEYLDDGVFKVRLLCNRNYNFLKFTPTQYTFICKDLISFSTLGEGHFKFS